MNVLIKLITRASLLDPADGRTLFALIRETIQSAYPAKCGSYEPIKTKFDLSTLVEHWEDPFFWISSDGEAEGTVGFARYRGERGSIFIDMNLSVDDVDSAVAFLHRAAIAFDAEFAFLHPPTQHDIEAGATAMTLVTFDASFRDLKTAIPYLYWGTIFGPSYLDLFGTNRVLSTPAAIVEELGPRHIYIQLTKQLNDVHEAFAKVAAARSRAIAHLGDDAFYDEGRAGRFRAPAFAD